MNRIGWIARLSSLLVVALLMVLVTGENGAGPEGREWFYLALFPFGFSIAYLAAWRWPVAGGLAALACMLVSQWVIQRTFDFQTYLIWAVMCIPAILFLFSRKRKTTQY